VTVQGEFVSIEERLVLSPAWGRLRADPVEEGRRIQAGAVIGMVRQPKADIPLVCPVTGRFLEWLAGDGERIRPGTPLALLRSEEDRPS
jgi:biotin carboxyl carrier protein